MPRQLIRVDVRGKIYPSVRAVCEEFGLTPNAVYSSMSRGRTHTLGLGTGARAVFKGGRPREFEFGGVKFSSMAEASRFLGLHPRTVSTIMRRKSSVGIQNMMLRMMKRLAEQETAAYKRANGKPAGFSAPVKNALAEVETV